MFTLPTISFVGGSTQPLQFNTYFYTNHLPYDLSQCTAKFAINSFCTPSKTALIVKDMTIHSQPGSEDGIVFNILRVTLLPDDTVDLSGKYIYQITVRDNYGGADIPDYGILYIGSNIDKASVQ